MKLIHILCLVIFYPIASYATIAWPFEPVDSAQPIGNSYGEYQYYGGTPYLHPGIDIMHPAGSQVFAVKSGWVKAVLTTAADYHWRVAIGDSPSADSCDGWLYAHLDRNTIMVDVGEYVDSGQYLGNIVSWPTSGFHHLHFAKIRGAGTTWSSDWLFVENPLNELVNADDFTSPYFIEIDPISPFRFCFDNSNTFIPVGEAVSGDVDIIARAHDLVGHPTWVVTPYAMGYEIYSDSVQLGPFTSFVFRGRLSWEDAQGAVFKSAPPCGSAGDYYNRDFYEIITNHDLDSLPELGDTSGAWRTGLVPNDTYTVKVWARDRYGNTAWDSMQVATANFYNITGTVTTSDGCPLEAGSLVAIPFTGASTSTTDSGGFVFSTQPAGRYSISASRDGYLPTSAVFDIFSNRQLELVLDPAPYVAGDVDRSGSVDISDAVFLVGFIFSGGPAPIPWASATHIDGDPSVDISDVVYIITYIFGGGTPPGGN